MYHQDILPDLASAAALFKNPVPTHGPKRNTACHQCRKRKLKCDTKKPCGTCVRSHQYAVAHSQDGLDVPPEPECTYGAEKEVTLPSSKVEKLENRIVELESLLMQMQLRLEESQTHSNSPASSYTNGVHTPEVVPEPPPVMVAEPAYGSPEALSSSTAWIDNFLFQGQEVPSTYENMDFSYLPASDNMSSTPFTQYDTPNYSTPDLDQPVASTSALTTFKDAQLMIMGWPQGLPSPEVTRHLVHAFFAFYMHAGRLFHGPTFLSSLSLPPTDSRFPFAGVLHAMCAVGSLYTADIPQPPVRERGKHPGTGPSFVLEELFAGRWRQNEHRPDSFAEQQAKLARIAGEAAIDRGESLMQAMQTQIILTWFYLTQARWSESYISSGHALRGTVPFGLNVSAPFHTADQLCPPTLLDQAPSITEIEMRRNIFWIAYAIERQQSAGNCFAMVLDDQDIFQLLPLRGDHYEQGTYTNPSERQWSHDRTMFLTHPPSQTDSFTLFIKGMILISHVKTFNLRYRGRYFAGDVAMYSPSNSLNGATDVSDFDPRDSIAFRELDHITTLFRQSFPSHLKNPTQDDMLDAYLYSACSAAHVAQIPLHEPHVKSLSKTCASTAKILKAARSILDLMYSIGATSYDVSLLDHLPILSWNLAGRVLIKALKAAIDENYLEEVMAIHAEVTYIYDMLAKAGENLPLAYRYAKVIADFLVDTCGRAFAEAHPLQVSAQRKRRNVSPQTNPYDHLMYAEYVYSPATLSQGVL
ncbi:hypothetical protein BDW22DRAFT_1363872 [Trametopsis cervina]|nr:hypothetical protein BDW22DRAFT_1363872 [Trametopsis cervina]